MKRKIVLTVASVLAAFGLALTASVPAQAFAPITYVADCPTNQYGEDATWQQLVIRNYSGSIIQITGWEHYPNGNIYNLGTTGASSTGEITYVTPLDGDVVRYDMSGSGNLNWYYHVDCFY